MQEACVVFCFVAKRGDKRATCTNSLLSLGFQDGFCVAANGFEPANCTPRTLASEYLTAEEIALLILPSSLIRHFEPPLKPGTASTPRTATPALCVGTLSREHGTYRTVTARSRPWFAGKSLVGIPRTATPALHVTMPRCDKRGQLIPHAVI